MNRKLNQFLSFLKIAAEIDRSLERSGTYYDELIQTEEELQEVASYFSTSEVVLKKLTNGERWLCVKINKSKY